MHAFYALVSGPLVWVAFALFLGGSIWKIASLLAETKAKDTYVVEYWSWRHAFASFLHWLVALHEHQLAPPAGDDHRHLPVPRGHRPRAAVTLGTWCCWRRARSA
jgi:hypothetical protein